jgi:hypothetical protein
VPIHRPSDTDRTEGIASVTIRTPDPRVVSRWLSSTIWGVPDAPGLRPIGVAVADATPALAAAPITAVAISAAIARAAVAVTAATAAVCTTVTAPISAAAAARTAGLGGRDRLELFGVLALDLGIFGHAQADAAPLTVDPC